MSFQRRSEAASTLSRVPEASSISKERSPTTKRAATVSQSHQLVTVGWLVSSRVLALGLGFDLVSGW